jgi:flagellar protein FlaG
MYPVNVFGISFCLLKIPEKLRRIKMSIQEISSVSSQSIKVEGKPVQSSPAKVAKEVRQPSPEEVETSINRINQGLHKNNVSLNFSIDDKTKIPVIKVTNTSTGDIVMQIPSNVILAVSEAIDSMQAGALIKNKA